MTTTQATSPRLTRLPDTQSRDRRNVALRHYQVSVGGEVIGTVGQMRVETMQAYSGRTYGYATYRTAWYWESVDNMGDYLIDTRAAAIAGLVDAALEG